jgi:hypothetical protein
MKQHPPRQIFEKLVNKNAIKCKMGGPPLAIFHETLDPPLGVLAKTSRTPSPGFSTRVHLCFKQFPHFYIVTIHSLNLLHNFNYSSKKYEKYH